MAEKKYLYTDGTTTTEQQVTLARCRLWAIRPDLTTTGTITLKSGVAASSTTFSVSAIGLTQAGKNFDGIVIPNGFTVTLSVGTDRTLIIYEPF